MSDYIRAIADIPRAGDRVTINRSGRRRIPAGFARCLPRRQAGDCGQDRGSEESRRAALAHTGSLAGSLQCFDAVAETVGVIRVDTLDEAVETAEYFSHAPIPKGPRLAGMTFSGGMKGLMLEAAERHGLSFPPLAPETLAKVGDVLGVGTSLGNPLDAGFAALSSAEAYFKCIEILRADPNVDLLLLQEELPPVPRTNNKVDNLLQVDRIVAESPWPPVAIVSMISYMFTEHTREFRAKLKNLPVLQEIDKALKAAGAAGRYGALRAHAEPAPTDSKRAGKPDIAPVLRRRSKATDGLSVLNEADRKNCCAPTASARRGDDRGQRRHRHHGRQTSAIRCAEACRRGATQIGYRRVARHPQQRVRAAYTRGAEPRQGPSWRQARPSDRG
jgi:hypothetical protein